HATDTKAGSSCVRTFAVFQRFSSPSMVFGGKNSNEKTGRRSSRISSIRILKGYARASGFLVARRNDVEIRGELRLPVHSVLHVHRVVLPVGAEQAEEDARPPDGSEAALLRERA